MWAESGRPWAPCRAAKPASVLVVGDLLDQVDDAPSQLGIADARKCLGERQSVRGGEKIGDIGRRRRLTHVVVARSRLSMRRALEEERDRHLKDIRNMLQPAGADAVGAFLVFLDLLKGQAERVAEFFLAHREHHPAHAHAAADMFVDRIRRLFGNHNNPLLYHPCLWVMAVDSSSVAIDSNSYAIYIPMVRHQVMRKCDKLPFLRVAPQRVARDGCDGIRPITFIYGASIGLCRRLYSGMPDRKRRRTTRKSAIATMTKAGASPTRA